MKPIIIQGAMDIEIDYLIKQLNSLEKFIINCYIFYKGFINDYPIIVSKTCIGTINCSAATVLGINKFEPACIINQGVAGGHGEHVHKGDIVIGEYCMNINSYETAKYEITEGVHFENWKLITWKEGPDVEAEKLQGNKTMLEEAYKVLRDSDYKFGNVIKGVLGSGDVWNREIDRIDWLSNRFGTLSEDMESIACYTISNLNNIPVIGIRIVSNSQINNEEYDRKIINIAQKNIINVVKSYIEYLKKNLNF